MRTIGSFTVSPKTAPPCACRKEQLITLGGEIPPGLNRRSLESFKPGSEETFTAIGTCSCGKQHSFTIFVNSINALIKQEGVKD